MCYIDFMFFERLILIVNKSHLRHWALKQCFIFWKAERIVKALGLETISSDFNEENISYILILSWFYSLTSNLFKNMIYGINDWLKLILQEEKWLMMIEEGDEDAQNKKEDP